jgi:uncharacterized membrane protein YraQ (UPF0718 family)/copper chaperone CopZ
VPDWLVNVPGSFWGVLSEMAPYLLFGFLAAGVLSVLVSPRLVERHLGGEGPWPVLKAALFGVPMPLCSCGVIPVAASLRKHGASRGATTAFLIATPQDGVDSILVSFSLLGPVFAIFRPIAALVSGLIGGTLVAAGTKDAPTRNGQAEPCQDDCCAETRRGRLRRIFSYGFGALPRDIGKALLVGLVIAALISAIVPKDYFAAYLGGGFGAMLVMMLLGVPVYVCATASVPIAAALVLKAGVSPGAALVFLMTGPATNAATIATVWKVMGRRTAVIYLATVMGTALAAGLTLDYIFRVQGVSAAPAMPWMLPGFVKSISAAALLAVLVWAAVGPRFRKQREPKAEAAVPVEKLLIKGMTCTHCAASVRRALLECAGVRSAQVDLAAGEAAVAGENLSLDELHSAVTALGYEVLPAGGRQG